MARYSLAPLEWRSYFYRKLKYYLPFDTAYYELRCYVIMEGIHEKS